MRQRKTPSIDCGRTERRSVCLGARRIRARLEESNLFATACLFKGETVIRPRTLAKLRPIESLQIISRLGFEAKLPWPTGVYSISMCYV
jgi:hypothetical protein